MQCYMLLSHQQVVITTCSPICIEIDPQIFWQKQHLLLHVLHRVHVENGGRLFFLLPRLSLCGRSFWWCFPCSFASRNSCRLPPPFFKLSFVGPKSKANKIHSHYSPIVFEKEQKAIIWECIEPRYIHGLEGNRRTFWGTDENQCKNVKISIGGFGVVNKRRLPRCRPISLQYTTLMYILFRISNIFFWNFLQREFVNNYTSYPFAYIIHINYSASLGLVSDGCI
jgi:hypothetical protein